MTYLRVHPQTRRFLAHLQQARARYLMRAGTPIEVAAEEGTRLARAFESAIAEGVLIPMEPNVVSREIAAGTVLREKSREEE